MVAGYRIDGVLGEGGMGTVYRATQLSLNRTVALKILAGELSDDPGFRERFRREGQLQAIIDHPHIVTVYEAGATEHGLFLAMRLVRGPNLKDAIVAHELDPHRTVALLAQVADALDSAHEVGLIHRDVKPQNILIGARDHAYLADFGLMKAPDADALTQTGQFVGTIDYVSPEQARGEGASGQSDVYALAGVLYECLTGDIPFARPSEAAILYAHMVDPPPKPSEHASLPEGLDTVVATGMAKDQDDRYATAGEMIRAAADALGVKAPAPAPSPADGGGGDRTKPSPLSPNAPVADPNRTTARGTIPAGAATAPARVPGAPRGPGEATSPARAAEATAPGAAAPTAGAAAATAAPTRRGGLPTALIVLAALLALAAIAAGLLIGRSGGGGEEQSDLSNSASAGNIGFSYPAGWSRAGEPGVPGLDLSDPIVLEPSGSGGARLVAGTTDARGAPLLPAPFLARLGDVPPHDDAVTLGGVQAYRYSDLRPRGLDAPITLYTVPTDDGVVTIGCVAGPGPPPGFDLDCDRIAASLELTGAKALPLGPSKETADLLERTAKRLDDATASATPKLRSADTPDAQARAASELSRAYATASRSLASADVGPADALAIDRLAAALGRVSAAYGRSADAARDGDSAAFAAAGRAVDRAGKAADRALGRLGDLGYRVS